MGQITIEKQFDDLIEWYWRYGVQREGRYEVTGDWLLRLYQQREKCLSSGTSSRKPRVGIWGPSQTGKSTLLSFCIDAISKTDGTDSALSWSGGVKVRFTQAIDSPSDLISLNPYNSKSDASGCISRFVLTKEEDIKFKDYPNELTLLNSLQVMTALAAGFDNECDTIKGANDRNEYNENDIDTLTGEISVNGHVHSKESFEMLHDLVTCIQILSKVTDRFKLLSNKKNWISKLVKAPGLDQSGVRKLRAKLLWNGSESIDALFDKINNFREQSLSWAQGETIFISTEVAALLLDIETYNNLSSTKEQNSTVLKRLESAKNLCWCNLEGGVGISVGEGQKIIKTNEDFGLLQALVSELKIPLKSSVVKKSSEAFFNLLEKSDIVDFPGLPNEDAAATTFRINADTLPENEHHKLLTRVLKRGKTLSIVTDSVRRFGVDSLLLLFRSDQFPARPETLTKTLETWWQSVDPTFPSLTNEKQNIIARPPLPLTVASTFFAVQITDRLRNSGLSYAASKAMLDRIGFAADPTLAHCMMVTYPHLPTGSIEECNPSELEKAVRNLKEDKEFLYRFGNEDALACLDDIANGNSGVNTLISSIDRSLLPTKRQFYLDQWKVAVRNELFSLLKEVMPGESTSDAKTKRIEKVLKEIQKSIVNSENFDQLAIEMSGAIRSLLSFPADCLDPVPVFDSKSVIKQYAQRQIVKAQAYSVTVESKYYAHLGLEDEGARRQLLNDLLDGWPITKFYSWLKQNTVYVKNQRDMSVIRNFIAAYLQSAYLPTPASSRDETAVIRRNVESIFASEANMDRSPSEENNENPHYRKVVQPFRERLRSAATIPSGQRKPQQGDKEVSQIFDQFQITN